MRVLVQRVASAEVEAEGRTTGRIGTGMLLLVGVETDDTDADIAWLSSKLARLRIFPDAAGVMNRNVRDAGGGVLAVSQFTLLASVRKGNRPSWDRAAPPDIAGPLFDRFVTQLEKDLGQSVPTGLFGANMQVHLINDGPVTIWFDSRRPE
jgi:D-aminoacyl-tRNA deacylase